MLLKNLVFRGTVFGPCLWYCYVGESVAVLESRGCVACVYADGYNAWRVFKRSEADYFQDRARLYDVQVELHRWGIANQVQLDPSKDRTLILESQGGDCDPVRMLGVFLTDLRMSRAISECVVEAGRRLRSLLRTRRYHSDRELLMLFKGHALSYLEYRRLSIMRAIRLCRP